MASMFDMKNNLIAILDSVKFIIVGTLDRFRKSRIRSVGFPS